MNAQDAIAAAIAGNWKEATKINLELLKADPKDLDTLNRLGRAYLETGFKTKAKNTYLQVLKLDKFNSIAAKNLEQLKASHLRLNDSLAPTPPPIFIEEPGVTKSVSLIRLGDPHLITSLHPGTPVAIVRRGHSVSVLAPNSAYLGRLPDDISSRLRLLIDSGNRYTAWVKSVDSKKLSNGQLGLKVFIKELSRSAKYKNTPSFPITEKLSYASFTPPELVHDQKPLVTTTEEDTESPRQPDNQSDDDADEPEREF